MYTAAPTYSFQTSSQNEDDYDYDPPIPTPSQLPPIKSQQAASTTSIRDEPLRPHVPAEVKIVELSRKLRRINVTLETEKTRANQLERQCKEYEQQIRDMATAAPPRQTSALRDAKEAQNKASQLMRKLEEERSAHNISKNESRHLKQLLEREVGGEIDINKQSLSTILPFISFVLSKSLFSMTNCIAWRIPLLRHLGRVVSPVFIPCGIR